MDKPTSEQLLDILLKYRFHVVKLDSEGVKGYLFANTFPPLDEFFPFQGKCALINDFVTGQFSKGIWFLYRDEFPTSNTRYRYFVHVVDGARRFGM